MKRTRTARLLETLVDPATDVVAWPNLPFVEPDFEAVFSQPLGKLAHDDLVFGTMAEKDVVSEIAVGHSITDLGSFRLLESILIWKIPD